MFMTLPEVAFFTQIDRRARFMKDFTLELIWAKAQMAITAIGGWLGYFVGGIDGMMIALAMVRSCLCP